MATYETDRWVSQYPVAADGGPQFGRHAQRAQVVNAFKETLDSNTAIRDTDTLTFNLLATPGYPEAIQNMIAFNTDRGLTAFVVGDTPFRLQPSGTALSEWGNNTNGALDNNDVGAVSFDEYMAMYYPSGFTNDNTGNNIVVPPSHMMLRTIINSDAKSFPWFAPAGTRRGGVDNATSVGYITDEGEFRSVALHQSLRDVLDDVKINPIATLTGVGILAYGQRTRARNASALDRINVSRLVCFLRRQLDIMARPFLFEPNDVQTRREIKAAAESIMLELVGQRALYDFIVVCDETNNTPARIDRNELYVDIAIEPVKAVEYIYIPLRLKNTGDIAAGL
jgi:phage tail sheath protein FI